MSRIAVRMLIFALSWTCAYTQQNSLTIEGRPLMEPPDSTLVSNLGPAKTEKKKNKNSLSLNLTAGMLYNSNIYRYGSEYIDAFEQGQRTYRYPSVKSIGDVVFPLGAEVTLNVGRLTSHIVTSGKVYESNSQMNRLNWSAELELHGRVSVHALYQQTPYLPIHPSSIIPYLYEMMWYKMDKGSVTVQLNKWNITPFIEASVGYDDYNHTFDYWDAWFYEGGAGFGFVKPFHVRITGLGGVSRAKPNTGHDPSNGYGGAKAEIHRRFGAWTPGIVFWVKDEVYTTADSLDSHKSRNDFLSNGNLYLLFKWRGLGLTATGGYALRETTSPIPKIDTRKDYIAWYGGIECSWNLKKRF